MKNYIIYPIVFLSMSLNAQVMSNTVKVVSKNDVSLILKNKEAHIDSSLSNKYSSNIYKLNSGEVLLIREDGKGGIWSSVNDFYSFINEDLNLENKIFNMEEWIDVHTNVEQMVFNSIDYLSKYLDFKVNYTSTSLVKISKIKIKNLVEEKDLFYAIILYTCGYYQSCYGGALDKQHKQNMRDYEPVIIHEGLIYKPYWEYVKSISDKKQISLLESIRLERIKYKLNKN